MQDPRSSRKPKRSHTAGELASPFTTLGGTTLDLDSTAPVAPRTLFDRRLEPAPESEFDVRKFLLDQKTSQPFHKSSLFRASSFANQVPTMESSRNQSSHSKPKQRLLPRMELGASKSTGALPPGTSKFHRTSRNQQAEDEDNGFYSIEKMAASCFHATQNKNKTWLFLPGSEERSKRSKGASSTNQSSITGVERPSRRVDVLDLDRCFDTAIQFASRKRHWEIVCEEKLSMLDQDFMAIHARVVQQYGSAAARENTSDEHKLLTRLLFDQKWADVVMGELEAMLTVSFVEQGLVLRKARILYAKAFFRLENLFKQQWQELKEEKDELELLKDEMQRTHQLHKEDAQSMKEHYEEEIDKLKTRFDGEKSEMERRVADSKEQLAKMGDTMRALNAIFRQMRDDTEKVKAVELRESYTRLEHKHEQCREEMEQLRPLIQEKQQLSGRIDELIQAQNALKDEIAGLNELLKTKDGMIASLMEEQSNLIAAQELKEAREEELRRQEEEENEAEEDEPREANSPSNDRRRGSISSTAVCVRCKEELRTMSANGGLAKGDKTLDARETGKSNETDGFKLPTKKRRVQCLYFRIMLPNLGGRRPQRDISWTFSCMRSIMFAKQIDDSMCKRTAGLFPLRIRMPEFVYAWFSPWKPLKDEKKVAEENHFDDDADTDDINDSNALERRLIQADEDRWCLYYGVRSLVQQGYLEAKLFLSLLDEKFGEDEQVFMLHCYRVLDVLLGGRLNWGPLRDKVSYDIFAREYALLFPEKSTQTGGFSATRRVPKTIWISPYHASLATSVILSKATETEREALDKKILEYVVSNVPEDERPEIYLEPKTKSWDVEPDVPHSKKRPALNRRGKLNNEPEEQLPSQFVDANLWVELMMHEYKEEQAHRRAAIRLMFQTATTSAAASASESAAEMSLSAMLGINCASMDMEQFRVMVHTLNDEIPSFMVATLFRNAYTRGNGTVNFDSFMDAAETWQFFSTCMRLEPPSSVVSRLFGHPFSRSPAIMNPSSRAASIVHKFFTILGNEIDSTIEELPLWTRSMTDSLAYEISSSLVEGGFSDGVRLLTLFQRLIDNIGVAKLIRRETTGSLFSSNDLFSIEKALHGLLDFARHREKSSAELLIDAVRQKLSVKRVQMKFRKRLLQDHGAPLVMRSLMHRRYGSGVLNYRHRRAERPVIWLRLLISMILRLSMQSPRITAVLGELSSISGAFHAGRSSLLQLTVSSALNGGIGPTPKPLFVEFIYDFFLEKFGSRCESERMIHDVFYNCRSFVRSDPLASLFSYLCCMSNSCPEDRLLGQNEALAFLHAIFRSGLHDFCLVNPARKAGSSGDSPNDPAAVAPSVVSGVDFVPIAVVETVLQTAFAKLSSDQKTRLRIRLLAAASTNNSEPPTGMEANSFLVFVLQEWRRYILHRLNEIRVACCEAENDLVHFEKLLQLETLSSILQKVNVTFTSEELCVILRRLYITEKTPGHENDPPASKPDPMSDRIAAACFPLVAKETLSELQILEHAAPSPFQVKASPLLSYEFLVSTWNDYEEPCQRLLDDLRQIGKNNDIQAKALSRWPGSSEAESGSTVLYLSSSSSSNIVSSQDVAQLEAVRVLFLERLQRLTQIFDTKSQDQDAAPAISTAPNGGRRRASISVHRDGSLHLVDEVRSQETMVNETWKVFRQMFAGFVKLRAIAQLGDGALPDQWERRSV